MLCSFFSCFGDEVLHCELFWVLVCLDHVVPLPEGVLVEDNIEQHVSSFTRRIIELVCPSLGFVADEDDLQPPEIELGKVGMHDLHVREVVEPRKTMKSSR